VRPLNGRIDTVPKIGGRGVLRGRNGEKEDRWMFRMGWAKQTRPKEGKRMHDLESSAKMLR